jgi:hypothetical protein
MDCVLKPEKVANAPSVSLFEEVLGQKGLLPSESPRRNKKNLKGESQSNNSKNMLILIKEKL